MKKSALISALAAAMFLPSAMGASFTFETLPPGGSVATPAGTTVGWGYRIFNPTVNWLELTNVSSDVFFNGTATSLFDFPILGPGAESIVPWMPGLQGLYEFTWDSSVSLGAFNTGHFTVDANFWDADPLSPGATLLAPADSQSAAYTVSSAGVILGPEPAAFWPMIAALVALSFWGRRRIFQRARCSAAPTGSAD